MSEYQLFINGGYTPAASGKTADSLNPATGEILADGGVQFVWDLQTVSAGQYQLVAVATDDLGWQATSEPLLVELRGAQVS